MLLLPDGADRPLESTQTDRQHNTITHNNETQNFTIIETKTDTEHTKHKTLILSLILKTVRTAHFKCVYVTAYHCVIHTAVLITVPLILQRSSISECYLLENRGYVNIQEKATSSLMVKLNRAEPDV